MIPEPTGPLVLETSCADGGFLLTGREASLEGHARAGVATLRTSRGELLRALRVAPGQPRGSLRLAPGMLARTLEVEGGAVEERILVPPEDAALAFQWTWRPESDANASSRHLRLSWRPAPGLKPAAAEGKGRFRLVAESGGRPRGLLTLAPRGTWRVRGDGTVEGTGELVPGRPLQLAVAGVGQSPDAPDLSFLAHLPDLARRLEADARAAEEALLGVQRPASGLGDGVAWARARLDAPLPASDSDAAWLALGGLVVGRSDVARRVLAARASGPAEEAPPLKLLREQAVLWAGLPGEPPDGDDAPGIPVAGEAPVPALRAPRVAARAHPVRLARGLCSLVAGTLGVRPDAPVGRLTLAPALPASWNAIDVDNIPMGAVRIGLRYRREGGRHTFSLRQSRGGVPANLVFAPLVPERELRGVLVDGEPAELDVVRERGRVGTRVQLPLDAHREVILDGRS